MKFLLLLLLLILVIADEHVYNYKILRVIDGDTIVFEAPFLPDPLPKELSLRIYGVDTPEKGRRARCLSESTSGMKSSEFTKNLIEHSSKQELVFIHWDKFGGRVLGDVLLDGVSLRQSLLTQGYVRPYFGTKKDSWCLTP